MAILRLYLDTRNKKKDGTYPVKIGVTNQKDFLISTGFSCKKEQWVGNQITGEKAKNASIKNKLNTITLLLLDLERKEIFNISDKSLKTLIEKEIKGEKRKSKTLTDTLDEHVSNKTKKSTMDSYLQTKDRIMESGCDVPIEDISTKTLIKFENYYKEKGMAANSIALHLRNIRAVNNYAIDQGYTENYPFRRYRIKGEETAKRSLTRDDLKKFLSFNCEPHMKRYRDYFFLTIYLCGINLADLSKIKDLKNGRIEYHRSKTSKFYSIKVEPEAMDIINRIKGSGYLVDISEKYSDYRSFNSRLNKMLKLFGPHEIVNKKGKKKYDPLFPNLSIYWARHSWASLAAEIDIPDAVISQALGHSTANPTTAIYINRNQKKVDEANRKVIDYINLTG